jgi:hypothetical protein
MATRTRRAATAVLGNGWTTFYTCPAGRTFRGTMMFHNAGAAQQDALLRIDGVAGGNAIFREPVPANSTRSLTFLVLNPGDVLQTNHSTGDVMVGTLWGSLLLGAPS